jgi:hypothetical protein
MIIQFGLKIGCDRKQGDKEMRLSVSDDVAQLHM